MSYREEMKEAYSDAKWTLWKYLPLALVVIVVLFITGFVLSSIGVFGSTVVERKVFENSYQRSEAIKSQINTDKAVLKEIEMKLRNPNLDKDTRFNLEAQASAARIRINTAERNK